jgi:F0F1-type ATP synthase delta subunit
MRAHKLAHTLYALTKDLPKSDVSKVCAQFFSYLEKRRIAKILPQVLHEYEQLRTHENEHQMLVTVASKHADVLALLKRHHLSKDAQVAIDSSIVGGYRIESDTELIDATYKTALLNLYHRITK